MRMLNRRLMPVIALVLAPILADCGDPNAPNNTISVLDNAFVPQTFNAKVGDTVTWGWGGQADHDVRFSDGVSSDVQKVGGFERTFLMAGTYNYICSLHIGMTGTVVVSQ